MTLRYTHLLTREADRIRLLPNLKGHMWRVPIFQRDSWPPLHPCEAACVLQQARYIFTLCCPLGGYPQSFHRGFPISCMHARACFTHQVWSLHDASRGQTTSMKAWKSLHSWLQLDFEWHTMHSVLYALAESTITYWCVGPEHLEVLRLGLLMGSSQDKPLMPGLCGPFAR